MAVPHYDVIIIGAGLSGICAARHLQESCPNKTFLILEGRSQMGGTWDLFKYPGVRSDSDMATLGYKFKPWVGSKLIADSTEILNYIRSAAEETGIKDQIRYNSQIHKANWSSEQKQWSVYGTDTSNATALEFSCSFFLACSGYYNYQEGYTPEFKGVERFRGQFIHPQQWPKDLDYKGKKVVVIGSGATAATLVPAMAEGGAGHVTMLQRSPTYFILAPRVDAVLKFLNRFLPAMTAYSIVRWKNILLATFFYNICKKYPAFMKKFLIKQITKALPEGYEVDKHFTPKYNPWDQRVCLIPSGDFFKAIRAGKSSIATDTIETIDENGIVLQSGERLDADIIVSATGLKLLLVGGIEVSVDGIPKNLAQSVAYKSGVMLSDVPNLAFVFGYTNASWTLKADLCTDYLCRLINYMDAKGLKQATPRYKIASTPQSFMIGLTSGYLMRGANDFPKQGSTAPWIIYQNYFQDRKLLAKSAIDDGHLEFDR